MQEVGRQFSIIYMKEMSETKLEFVYDKNKWDVLTQNTVCWAEKQQAWQISSRQQSSWWKTIQNRSSLCILSVVSSSKMSWLSLGCRQGWKQENDSNITYYSSITNPSCNRTSIWTLLHQCKVNNRTGDLLIELAELGWATIFLSDEIRCGFVIE